MSHYSYGSHPHNAGPAYSAHAHAQGHKPSPSPGDDWSYRQAEIAVADQAPRAPPAPLVNPGTFALLSIDPQWLRDNYRYDRNTLGVISARQYLVVVHDAAGAEASVMFVCTHPPGRGESGLKLPTQPMPHHRVRINEHDYRTVSVPGFPHTRHQCIWTTPPLKVVIARVTPPARGAPFSVGSQVTALNTYASTDLHAQGLQWIQRHGSWLPSANTGYIDNAMVSMNLDINSCTAPGDPLDLLALLSVGRKDAGGRA